MKYCPECGKPNCSQSVFCGECGAAFPAFSVQEDSPASAPASAPRCAAQQCVPPAPGKFRYWIPWAVIAAAVPLLCAAALLLD